ncbi:MAG: hypothetical protein HC800_25025 [Phormidesmis sp. RL_2_1]|nr:hypothetical protein [Phormidesmis sp. RL_2_1]
MSTDFIFATLTVCRRLDNRLEGQDDQSLRAKELHRMRALALHDVIDSDPVYKVNSWGQTDDEKPHEWIEIELILLLTEVATEVSPHVVPALQYVGDALLQTGIGAAGTAVVSKLFQRLRKQQQEGKLRDVELRMTDVATVSLHPDSKAITVTLAPPSLSVPFDADEQEVNKLQETETDSKLMEVPTPLIPFVRSMIEKHKDNNG